MKFWHRAILGLLIVLLLGMPARATHAIDGAIDIESQADGKRPLGHFLHLYYDSSGRMTRNQIAAADARGEFTHAGVAAPSLGYQSGASWARFDLYNPDATRQTRWLLINWPFQQHYNLYLTGADGRTRSMQSGSSVPIEQRPLASRYFLFPLELDPGEKARVYLRASGQATQILDVQLWRPGAFVDHIAWYMAWKYLALGSTLIVLVFSIFSWQLHRRPGLLALAPGHLMLVCAILGLDAFYADWVPADTPLWSNRIANGCVNLGMFLHAQFARSFLELGRRFPRLDRIFAGLIWLILASTPVLIFFEAPMQYQQGGTALLVLLSLAIVRAAWGGDRKARGYLLAWGFLFAGILMRAAQVYGWLPDISYIGNLPLFGLITSVLILSLIIYRDMRTTRRHADAARQMLLTQQQGEQDRLSRAVEERTAELQQALASAEMANRAKTIFLSSMSHELRTPLHTVLGYSALLKQQAGNETRARAAIIERSGRQLLRLIDDLLCFSRDEVIPMALHPEPAHLSALLDHLREQGERMAAESGNQFRLECDENLPATLDMDEPRLLQVLLNLLGNACKYTHAGMINLRIAAAGPVMTQADPPTQTLLFEVSDNGPGIAPADQVRIFEPFVRLADQAAHPGLGLGLGIARQWVRGMGGDIDIVSELNQGCRFSFTLTLPLAQPPAGPAATQPSDATCPSTDAPPLDIATPSAEIMAELLGMLREGRLPALKLRAEALMREHPQSRDFLLNIQACCTSIDLPGLNRLLRPDPGHPPA